MAKPRSGRRRSGSTARADILQAARNLFAQNGFATTSLRSIAARAGVDVALIPYYFGNKRGLFVAAMELPMNPELLLAAITAGPRSEFGARLAATFVQIWESAETGPALQAFLRTAVADGTAAATVGEFFSEIMLPLASSDTGLSPETVRMLGATMAGLATVRYLIGVPALRELSAEEVVEIYAPRLQAVIDVG